MKKKVHIFLFDGFSDWEIAFLSPELSKSADFVPFYFTVDGSPVTSMGALRVSPDSALKDIDVDEVDTLVLPGGTAWEKGENGEISSLVQELLE